MFPNRHGGGGSMKSPFLESIERLKEEYNALQNQLQSQRQEMEKLNAERDTIRQHYMMSALSLPQDKYYEMSCGLNLEMHKQTEIAKRYSSILTSLIPFVGPEQANTAVQAMERAKHALNNSPFPVSVAELQGLSATSQVQQIAMMPGLGMAGPMGMHPGLNPAALAALTAGMRPPGMDEATAAAIAAAAAGMPVMARPDTAASRQSRPRSHSPGGSVEKRLKVDPDDNELEIDVQNDDAPTGAHSSNGRAKDGGRESASLASSGASTPAARRDAAAAAAAAAALLPGLGGMRTLPNLMDPHAQARIAAAMLPNGKGALYSYKMTEGNQFMPFSMPEDAITAPGLPRNIKAVHELPHGEVVCAVSMAKNSKHVYTGGKGCVKIWDIGGPSVTTPLASLECLKDNYIRSCKLYNDGSVLIVGGEASVIAIWDMEKKTVIGELDSGSQACYALALSEDKRQLFACCADGNVVIWDIHNRQRLDSLPGHTDGASCVDLSPDGNKLWTGGLDHTLRTWDLRERKPLSQVGFDSQIFSLGCCPTEEYTAVGMENNNVEVLHHSRPTDRYRLHRHDSCVLSLKFAHSGNWFCTTGKDNMLNLWRTPYGAGLVRVSENSSVLSCDISTDDQYIVTGSGDKKATVYQIEYN